jgi:acyl carrier protein
MPNVSFDEVADLVADFSGAARSRITPSSRVESDLGITGDDGVELLQALAARFGTNFNRPDHSGRYLFGSEGHALLTNGVRYLLGRPKSKVIPITVGDLHLAVVRGQWEDPPWPAI